MGAVLRQHDLTYIGRYRLQRHPDNRGSSLLAFIDVRIHRRGNQGIFPADNHIEERPGGDLVHGYLLLGDLFYKRLAEIL